MHLLNSENGRLGGGRQVSCCRPRLGGLKLVCRNSLVLKQDRVQSNQFAQLRPLCLMNTNLVVVRDLKEDRLFAMPVLHVWAHNEPTNLGASAEFSSTWIELWMSLLFVGFKSLQFWSCQNLFRLFVYFDTMVNLLICISLYAKLVGNGQQDGHVSLHGCVSCAFPICKNVTVII